MAVESPGEYLDAAPEPGRPWPRESWAYVEARSPGLDAIMFRHVPMYRFADSDVLRRHGFLAQDA